MWNCANFGGGVIYDYGDVDTTNGFRMITLIARCVCVACWRRRWWRSDEDDRTEDAQRQRTRSQSHSRSRRARRHVWGCCCCWLRACVVHSRSEWRLCDCDALYFVWWFDRRSLARSLAYSLVFRRSLCVWWNRGSFAMRLSPPRLTCPAQQGNARKFWRIRGLTVECAAKDNTRDWRGWRNTTTNAHLIYQLHSRYLITIFVHIICLKILTHAKYFIN